jgi:hypothetical protein
VPRLDGPVTSFQHSFIVSDQGQAAIWGHDASAQAEQIIAHVAHPSVPSCEKQGARSDSGSKSLSGNLLVPVGHRGHARQRLLAVTGVTEHASHRWPG